MRPIIHFARRFPIFAMVFSLLALPCRQVPAADVGEDITISLEGMQFLQPCSGEMVTLHGNMTIHSDTSSNGDDVFVTYHIDTHGVSATTSVLFPGETPRKYISNQIDNETMHFRFSAGPTTQQVETNWTFLRTGEANGVLCCGDDFLCHTGLHVTFVNGRTTATPDSVRAECN